MSGSQVTGEAAANAFSRAFWGAIASGDEDAVRTAARDFNALQVRVVEDSSEGRRAGDLLQFQGELVIVVPSGSTAGQGIGAWWKKNEDTVMIALDNVCGARTQEKNHTSSDFRACGRSTDALSSDSCSVVPHQLDSTDRAQRSIHGLVSTRQAYGIATARGQKHYFSRGVIYVAELPSGAAHELLLTVEMKARNFLLLLQAYPGAELFQDWLRGPPQSATPESGEPGEEVTEAPGVISLLLNPPGSSPRHEERVRQTQTRLSHEFATEASDFDFFGDGETEEVVPDDGLPEVGASEGQEGSPGQAVLQAIADIQAQLDVEREARSELEATINLMVEENRLRDEATTVAFRKLKAIIASRPGGTSGVSSASLVQDVILKLHREGAVLGREERIQTKREMDLLQQDISQLKHDMYDDDGRVDVVEGRVDAAETKSSTSSFTVAGVTFKSEEHTQAWVALLPSGFEFYIVDMKRLFFELYQSLTTVESSMTDDANANKAQYSNAASAREDKTFVVSYPAVMITTKDHNHRWGPLFESPGIFDGNTKRSTFSHCKKDLAKAALRFQKDINAAFPRSNPRLSMVNGVLSDVLQRSLTQAKAFLESWMPFYRLLSDSGMDEKEAWESVLLYVMTVFDRVQELREVGHKPSAGAKLFAVLRTTAELDSFVEADFIRHSSVLAGLAIASMQRDAAAGELTQAHELSIKGLLGDVLQLKGDMKKLRNKKSNPTLKFD